MKRSSKELKRLAREALMGNYGNFSVIYLFYFIISLGIQLIPTIFLKNSATSELVIMELVSVIIALITSVLSVGLQKTALQITRKEPVTVRDLFFGFEHHPDKYIILTFLFSVVAVAFQLPTIALAIIMTASNLLHVEFFILLIIVLIIMLVLSLLVLLRYALSFILLMEDSELGCIDAMKMSAELMQGQKGRYFYLTISFLGLQLLSLFTLGIAQFWLAPYMNTTMIQFYRDITGELDHQAQAYPER